jgi:hypothetical protein
MLELIIALLSSVIFATGLIITSRHLSRTAQLVTGIVLMVLAVIIVFK